MRIITKDKASQQTRNFTMPIITTRKELTTIVVKRLRQAMEIGADPYTDAITQRNRLLQVICDIGTDLDKHITKKETK